MILKKYISPTRLGCVSKKGGINKLSEKKIRLEFDTQRIDALKKLNDEFLLVKIYAMATGKNRNFTYISKEDTIEAIPSAYYCPVVGHIRVYVDNDGVEHMYMGSHDFEITDDWEIKDVTRPYGVIVEGSEGWETVEEHGKEVEYLTFNAILWVGRYPELMDATYSDDILFNHSMEINIKNYRPLEEDSNYWEVLGYTFSAFCLLGKADENSTNGHTDKDVEHSEPAFISSKVVPYEFGLDEFKKEFSLLKDRISDFIDNFEINYDKVVSFADDVTVNETEGGESMADETKNVDTAVTDFEENSAENENVEPETVEPVNNEENFEDGSNEEATAEVEEEPTENGTEEENNEEPTEPAEELPDYEAMYNDMKNAYEGVVAEFEAYKSAHTYSNEEYQILVEYKQSRENADRESAENELFESFADRIGETEEFEALKSDASNYSIEDLKMRLYAIVGMHSSFTKDGNKNNTIKFGLGGFDEVEKEKDPYGNAREYYM